MTKVLPCTGPGIGIDEATGGVTVNGPRKLAWRSACDINLHNGLKFDPPSGKLWASPDPDVKWTQVQPAQVSYDPAHTGSHAYTPYKISLTTRDCMRTHARLHISNGMSTYFMNSGDWWVTRRQVDVTIDGESTHSSQT
jgi:hypothetical protein